MQSSWVLVEQWRAKALTAVDLSLRQSAAVLVHLAASRLLSTVDQADQAERLLLVDQAVRRRLAKEMSALVRSMRLVHLAEAAVLVVLGLILVQAASAVQAVVEKLSGDQATPVAAEAAAMEVIRMAEQHQRAEAAEVQRFLPFEIQVQMLLLAQAVEAAVDRRLAAAA
jgi:hypothetical protein